MFLIAITSLMLLVNVNADEFETTTEEVQKMFVEFDNMSDTLDSHAKAKLDTLDTSGSDIEGIYVGKTDSRGSDMYNYILGLKRAQMVADYVGLDRNTVTSNGKNDAIEDDINNMRKDRIVLIKIITYKVIFKPVFGAAGPLMGPTHHLQYNTLPQGMNRM